MFLYTAKLLFNSVLDQLEKVTDLIKKDCPHCVTFINEAQDLAVCNYNRLNGTWAQPTQCLPKSLDWFGYDYYDYDGTFGNNSGWEVMRKGNKEQLYPRLYSHQ